MEKMVIGIGMVIACAFFTCAFVIGSGYLWGVVVGIALILFGWYFDEDY
jgi:hypothetical protein